MGCAVLWEHGFQWRIHDFLVVGLPTSEGHAGADPGFPVGGGANLPWGAPTYDFPKFCEKLQEIEKNLGRHWHAPTYCFTKCLQNCMKIKEFGPGALWPWRPFRFAPDFLFWSLLSQILLLDCMSKEIKLKTFYFNHLEWRYWCVQYYISSALNTLVHFLMKNYSVNLNFIKIKNRGELGPDFGHVVVGLWS